MVEKHAGASLGDRIKAYRKARGIKSTSDLAELTGGVVSAATLQNIESGRKTDIPVSTLLNIALALRVAPTFLLAPMANPGSNLDLPNLSAEMSELTIANFDAWFAGLPEGAIITSGADRNERQELLALREISVLLRERRRLETMSALESGAVTDPNHPFGSSTARRLAETEAHITELTEFLSKAGWDLGDWVAHDAEY